MAGSKWKCDELGGDKKAFSSERGIESCQRCLRSSAGKRKKVERERERERRDYTSPAETYACGR